MNWLQKLAVGTVIVLCGAASVAIAQPSASQQPQGYGYMMGPWMMGTNGMIGGPMGPGMMGGGPGGNGQGGSMCSMMNYQIGGRLAYLKAELQITQPQEALWNAYADAVQKNSRSMAARCNSMMGGNTWNTLSLPDRLTRHEQFMALQIDALRAIDKSLKPLYATFSDSQKKVADQLIWCPMGMM
ncbi:MAG: Spy/CpxP family protein refolding chaperone [Rhizomicrobium sp.]